MEEKNENVVEETIKVNQQDPGDENVVKVDESKFESAEDDSVTKVDLNKLPTPKEENEVKEDNADDSGVVASTEDADAPQEQKEIQPETETQEVTAVEEISNEVEAEAEEIAEQAEEAIKESLETGKPLPENIEKLVNFMEETGGDLNDYVKLNQDYSQMNSQDLLYEFYRQTKPHLDNEEINFLMEDNFSFDEDVDDDRDIRRKKLALKEQVANAKSHLDGQKSKYYEEIKMGSKLPDEAKKAMDFFNRYNKESEVTKKAKESQNSTFKTKTNNLFNDKFKGFEYDVGDKKFRVNVKNVDNIRETQSSSDNFFKKFFDENNHLKDAKDFHKSMYTAVNADNIANHFYEQGKSDAIKNSIAKAKNVSMDPRQSHGVIEAGGLKVRVLGEDSSDFKFKIKNKNK